jgi:hypothetical protein
MPVELSSHASFSKVHMGLMCFWTVVHGVKFSEARLSCQNAEGLADVTNYLLKETFSLASFSWHAFLATYSAVLVSAQVIRQSQVRPICFRYRRSIYSSKWPNRTVIRAYESIAYRLSPIILATPGTVFMPGRQAE